MKQLILMPPQLAPRPSPEPDPPYSRTMAYRRAYNERDYVAAVSAQRAHAGKLDRIKHRLEKYSLADLMEVAASKCADLGIDFAANRETIEAVLTMLNMERPTDGQT